MLSRRLLLGAALACLLVGLLGAWLFVQQRVARCAPTPFNPNLISFTGERGLPEGWTRQAGGVELRGPAIDGQGFELDGDGQALQLLGVGNYARTPAVSVQSGESYCFSTFALTDSAQRSPTRARLVFEWQDAVARPLAEMATLWQPVTLWTPEAPPHDWAALQASFVAPAQAASLAVRIEPASDDRIYLDMPALRRGGTALNGLAARPTPSASATSVALAPWPYGHQAAIAFTFDWETAMGGLVHSRSVNDPHNDQDYLLRAMRMREGITTTMALFEPLQIRATYYATGYNLLDGNQERQQFLNNPTFAWATPANGWIADRWVTTPWFADDPFGTLATHPQWYFGDLLEPLRAAGHEIQSHTFSHLHGGLADLQTWQLDLETWDRQAVAQGLPGATSLAFPWSSSAGMSDAAWGALEAAGIRSVTRLSDQAQYSLWQRNAEGLIAEPHCRWFPGREGRLLACPDFYVTPERIGLALRQVEQTVTVGGMLDLWAHTEEVTAPEQIAAWRDLSTRIAHDPRLWVAPMSEIAAWQTASALVQLEPVPSAAAGTARYRLSNQSDQDLPGLSLRLPAGTRQVFVQDEALRTSTASPTEPFSWSPEGGIATLDLAAGQSLELQLVTGE